MDQYLIFTFFASFGLALAHILAAKLRFLEVIPRSKWLSGAGGVSVAYVFIHVFPELGATQKTFKENMSGVLSFVEHHVYLLALIGFIAFYILERFVKETGSNKPSSEDESRSSTGTFWIHIVSFAIYNALVGYLLVHREEKEWKSLFFFFIAMVLHFIVNDFGLRQHHRHIYDRIGRWILAFAVVVGWLIGAFINLDVYLVASLFAFLAGSIILNVLKEELPEDRKSSPTAFFIGAASYAVLLLTL